MLYQLLGDSTGALQAIAEYVHLFCRRSRTYTPVPGIRFTGKCATSASASLYFTDITTTITAMAQQNNTSAYINSVFFLLFMASLHLYCNRTQVPAYEVVKTHIW